jgi:hypothetical protein
VPHDPVPDLPLAVDEEADGVAGERAVGLDDPCDHGGVGRDARPVRRECVAVARLAGEERDHVGAGDVGLQLEQRIEVGVRRRTEGDGGHQGV